MLKELPPQLNTTDLFMYREPAQRERAERLGTILLAADLDNLEGAAERVSALQEQIFVNLMI